MSINKVILVGNVGKDPEVRYIDNNVPVATITVATSERAYKTSNGTEIPERTEWHNVVLWRGLAEVAEKYVRKGTQVYIEGKIKTRSWADQTGAKRYATEIIADNMELLGRRGEIAPLAAHGTTPSVSGSTTTTEDPFKSSGDAADDLPF
ncbi:MAG: single-stranded DNA-binding protein [Bacteroidales bacterium]|nr:single-stranded DNA-binding protein [Bacteroidales bacterium]